MATMMEQEQVTIDEAKLRLVMGVGGRADVTVRSTKSGQHVRVSLSAKMAKPGGGYVSRAKRDGRVGILDADVVFANDPAVEFFESGLAKHFVTGKYAGRTFVDTKDEKRGWIATMLLAIATGTRESFPPSAEVFLATRCCVCNKKLEDPESIERGIGPECFGQKTDSIALPHVEPAKVAAEAATEEELAEIQTEQSPLMALAAKIERTA